MAKRETGTDSNDGIVSEDVTPLMEHIELPGENRLMDAPGWEMKAPVEDLDDAPIEVDGNDQEIPDLDSEGAAADIELFTETELDLNRRLLQVEDEGLELTATLGAERARWQKRVESLQRELAERNQLLAEREQEIENLSAQLASMTVARDGYFAELRELKRSVGEIEATAVQQAAAPMGGAIEKLRERMHERGRALLVAREEIDRLRREHAQLVDGLAERGEFIQRLHERLRKAEGAETGSGQLRRQLRRLFGGEQHAATPMQALVSAPSPAEEPVLHDDPSPRPVAIAELPQAHPPEKTPLAVRAVPGLRRYLIGLDLVGRVHEITRPRVSVGRTQDNDLRIVDPTVSRLHAVLNAQGADVTVIDANSRNGVYVNGIQVRHAKLSDGDLLTFGTVRFRYRIGSVASGGGFGPA